ncbi:putative 26S proteasome regulatory subunit [Saitozyma podzolica]|uniref:Probable 26S proteasome regulatory subunit p27 n=1 Tax=Saitozyma podzolica TaxID=1890683 RepID=A0A427Y812_9TREE|nr:putative 26S proteasome regulatory subunit [Saitozyma podzolica]
MAFPAPAEPPSTSFPLPHPEAYPGEPREYARALMQRKDEIEAEMEALKEVLASHGTTPETSLFDPEGYPRADIDIYAIRHARSALARLHTDRNLVNERLAPALEAAFQREAGSAETSAIAPLSTSLNGAQPLANGHDAAARARGEEIAMEAVPDAPVAKVNSVAPGSPAADAGLNAGDYILDFAGVTAPGGLQDIGALVQRSEMTPLRLVVSRGSEAQRVVLTLTPRSGWGGRGLLGCHILPA